MIKCDTVLIYVPLENRYDLKMHVWTVIFWASLVGRKLAQRHNQVVWNTADIDMKNLPHL